MPIEDAEKTAAEIPLKSKLAEIMDCERCTPPPDPAQNQENIKAAHDATVTVNSEKSPGDNNPQENVASSGDDANKRELGEEAREVQSLGAAELFF